MLDLALSVLFSSLIFVIFKFFTPFKVQTPYAIVVNYVIASSVGILSYDGAFTVREIPIKPWFPGTFVLGVLFIVVFNIMAKTSQRLGVSVASVATKMSLVIPVLAGVILYREILGPVKIIGIVVALVAVYFASVRKKSLSFKKENLLLPFLLFLGSGIVDSGIKYLEETQIPKDEFSLFTASVFASASFTGIIFVLIRAVKTPLKPNLKNVLGGIALGIPNFFSIYFLLRALQSETLNSASVFTINNVAIVMVSTLLGIALFKEYISVKNWAGIAMAVVSILLVAFG
jgi:drug/metabolite transporter (DMT)-like permease